MAVLRRDYSAGQVLEIASSRYLASALVRMRSREEFAYLVALFSDAVGPELMCWLMESADKALKKQ
jgi:hypothetical protein